MGTYVISDIHGCYKEFLTMLDKIRFSDTDQLVLAGDYIDKGKQSYEMLQWIVNCLSNVVLIRGNHDEEFAGCIGLMLQIDKKEKLASCFSSNKDAIALYQSVKYVLKDKDSLGLYFDMYGTIKDLLYNYGVTLEMLCKWAETFLKMPYYYELQVKARHCVIVHAGYARKLEDTSTSFSSLEEFYLYARAESIQQGGIHHGIVIAGHTPTIAKGEFAYNKGNVFKYYDKEKDCIFYDIDCGCTFRNKNGDAKLACIRLEDEKIFYV